MKDAAQPKHKSVLLVLVVLVASFFCFLPGKVWAQSRPRPEGVLFPLRVTGSDGKVLSIERPPRRIVALDSGAVEILFALREGDRIIGAHEFLSYPPETRKIERVGNSYSINFERIVSMRPDLVFIFFDRFVPELRRLGVPVLYLTPPHTLKAITERMRLWGKIVGRYNAAESLARDFEKRLEVLKQRITSIEKGPRVFHDAAPGLWTLGKGSLADDVYKFLRAENIFGDLSGAHQVSPEVIVARNPELIISMHDEGPTFFREHPAFRSLEAVRKGKLFFVESSLFSVAGPRIVRGIEQLAKTFYPNLLFE